MSLHALQVLFWPCCRCSQGGGYSTRRSSTAQGAIAVQGSFQTPLSPGGAGGGADGSQPAQQPSSTAGHHGMLCAVCPQVHSAPSASSISGETTVETFHTMPSELVHPLTPSTTKKAQFADIIHLHVYHDHPCLLLIRHVSDPSVCTCMHRHQKASTPRQVMSCPFLSSPSQARVCIACIQTSKGRYPQVVQDLMTDILFVLGPKCP